MSLYSGRFSGSLDPLAAELNNSLPFDQRLAFVDIKCSIAWAHALGNAAVLKPEETQLIVQGLSQVQSEFEQKTFAFQPTDEDIHTAVERRLTELIGPTGGKLHTGRSRNDQVATDFRLWILDQSLELKSHLLALLTTLIERSELDIGTILPGYTHFQQAQPILLSHWWLSHFWALKRDLDRLIHLRFETAVLPLGCGALAGTTFPIDRFALAQELDFRIPSPNSLDAISDRDFAAEFLFWAAMVGVHLSRMAEALILYSTNEFRYLAFTDAFSTGSSLMPQKKNPDPLELTRGKAGGLIGKMTGLLTTLKGLPSAYDKDLQEDKIPVFEASDTLSVILPVMEGIIRSLMVYPERMKGAIDSQILATDLADYLVNRGIPFRQAHSAVAQAVRRALDLKCNLNDMPLAEWQGIQPAFQNDLYQVFDMIQAVSRRSAWGGTSPEMVTAQIKSARQIIGRF